MRMRRKTYLEERMAAVAGVVIDTSKQEINALEAVKTKEYIDFEKVFGKGEVYLEIGCGKGAFVAQLAQKNPDKGYIAVERITNVVVAACELICQMGICNVRFINTNAAYLPRYIAPSSVSGIYINFPNPLPESAGEKKRLTSPRYLESYKSFLADGGTVRLKTDDKGLFEFSKREMEKAGFDIRFASENLHAEKGLDENIATEHENKFAARGLNIFYLEAVIRK